MDFVDSRNYAIFVGDNLENHLSNDSLLQQSLFIIYREKWLLIP